MLTLTVIKAVMCILAIAQALVWSGMAGYYVCDKDNKNENQIPCLLMAIANIIIFVLAYMIFLRDE